MTSSKGTGIHMLTSNAQRAPKPRSISRRVVLTLGLVSLTAAVIGFGAFAVFTDTASVTQNVSSGTVVLNPLTPAGANNRLSIGASNIAAGDTIQRTAILRQNGTIALSGITLTTTAPTSSLLNTDTTNGLQMVIERCSVAWTEAGPPYTYTCSGTTSTVLATRPVVGSAMALSNLSLAPSADNFLRVTLTLPSAAPNSLQGQSSVINYAFTATQRAGAPQ